MDTRQKQEDPATREEMLGVIAKQQPDMAEKLQRLADKEGFLRSKNVYGETYSDRQIHICYDAIFRTEYLRCRILEASRETPRSVKQIAELLGKTPGDILVEVVELRRKNRMVIEKVEDRTPLYRAAG